MIIIGGLYSTNKMDIDVFPDLTAPTVVVMTDAPNRAAEEVERLVTFPIETAVNGATDVRRVRSSSMPGYSFVWVEFDWGTDIFKARQIVSEKMVTLTGSLPPEVTPILAPQSSVMGEIMFISLQSDSTSMMDLRTLAEWVVKPSILSTGGVSQVTIIGGDYKQYQVLADPVRMNVYGVSLSELEDVLAALGENASGGVVREYGNEYALRGMSRTIDLDEMAETYVKSYNGKPILLGDVATVKIGSAVKMGYASKNAKPAVLLSVSKQPNINTLKVTQSIEKRLEDLRASLPSDVKMDTDIFKQSDFIEASVHNVGRALLEGALFVVLILFLFLGSFRTTLISVIAIPLSLLGAMIVLYLMGLNINTMTLGGLCIAIGSLVDDAIIDVENVYKRLRENYLLPKEQRQNIKDVVFKASTEIRASILNATFIIIVAFTPLFLLSGMEGRMLKPLGIAYIVSLFMSLLVAMTVTPLLCKLMLGSDKYLQKKEKENKFITWLQRHYHSSLSWSLNHGKIVVGTALALFVTAGGIYFTLGHGFLPDFNEGSLTISVVTKPGVSLDENHKIGELVETQLLSIPEVKSTARRTGRGELDEHSQATNSAEVDVKFDLKKRPKEEFLADVRAHLAAVPGIASTVGQPLGHRIDHMLSGTRANIAIKIFGTDLSHLFRLGNQVMSDIADIEGLVDVSVEQQTVTPEWQIRPNRAALSQYGIPLSDFNKFVRTAFAGNAVAQVYEGQRSFDLVLRYSPDYTETIEGVGSALITTSTGKKVALEEVAEIVSVGGANSISRENVQRKIVVSANVAGRDLQGAVNEIQSTVKDKIQLPEGYRIEYGGQFESAQSASRTLMLASLAALIIIFLLLYAEFKEVSLSAIVLLNLPLALIGGIWAIFFSSKVVSIPSLIGFITLFGIATRNGILLISRYKHLHLEGEPLREAIIKGSKDRLNPILMTALTAALALIPLIISGDKSGNEIQSPMAIVVLGGLLTSTLLNVYVVPVVYQWFRRRQEQKQSTQKGIKIVSIALILCFFAYTPVMAQESKPTEVVKEYKNSTDLLADMENVSPALMALKAASEAEKLGVKTGIVPSNPEFEFAYSWGNKAGIGDKVDFAVTQSFDFPTVYANQKKMSEIGLKNISYKYGQESLDWYIQARALCIEVVYRNSMEKVWVERIDRAEKLVESYQKSFQKGEANSLELNKAKMNNVKLKNEYQAVKTQREGYEIELGRLIGGVKVRLLQAEFEPMEWPTDFETWFQEICLKHPAISLSEGELEASKKNVSLVNSHSLPVFTAGYKGENVLGEGYNGLMVGMSVPLWENKNKTKQAKMQSLSAELSSKDTRLALRSKYSALYIQAAQMQQSIEEYNKTLEEAGNTEMLEKALSSGQISLLNYLLEQEYYFDLYASYLGLFRDLAMIHAQWEVLEK